ncbi:hypothetical protein [Novosphingobium malaysiense]|nr:hypothetical protein [Novosphingobium malaysiense]
MGCLIAVIVGGVAGNVEQFSIVGLLIAFPGPLPMKGEKGLSACGFV